MKKRHIAERTAIKFQDVEQKQRVEMASEAVIRSYYPSIRHLSSKSQLMNNGLKWFKADLTANALIEHTALAEHNK